MCCPATSCASVTADCSAVAANGAPSHNAEWRSTIAYVRNSHHSQPHMRPTAHRVGYSFPKYFAVNAGGSVQRDLIQHAPACRIKSYSLGVTPVPRFLLAAVAP